MRNTGGTGVKSRPRGEIKACRFAVEAEISAKSSDFTEVKPLLVKRVGVRCASLGARRPKQVGWRQAMSGFIDEIAHLACLRCSTDGDERRAFEHAVSGSHANARDFTVALGRDVVFHLPGFEHHDGVALLHGLTGAHQDLGDHTGQGRCNGCAFAGSTFGRGGGGRRSRGSR